MKFTSWKRDLPRLACRPSERALIRYVYDALWDGVLVMAGHSHEGIQHILSRSAHRLKILYFVTAEICRHGELYADDHCLSPKLDEADAFDRLAEEINARAAQLFGEEVPSWMVCQGRLPSSPAAGLIQYTDNQYSYWVPIHYKLLSYPESVLILYHTIHQYWPPREDQEP